MSIINPNEDGISHINIYSKGQTQLGRMLSNFYKCPITTKDGKFMSVEGYWYWLGIEECPEKNVLRYRYGYDAKALGKKLLNKYEERFEADFERKILIAIWDKFKKHAYMLVPEYYDLPFEHYYNYGGKIVDVKSKYSWMFDGIEKMRQMIIRKTEAL